MFATALNAPAHSPVNRVGARAQPCPTKIKIMQNAGDHNLPIAISDTFVAEILRPYRANAKYLKSAQIIDVFGKTSTEKAGETRALVTGSGQFAIPESCYIDDTGHFNAVEFNICYNQLAYVLFAKCLEDGILGKVNGELHKLSDAKVDHLSISMADYKRHQLPSMLIVSIEGVRFFKEMKSSDFQGQLTINRFAPVGDAWFFFTTIAFSDAEGVKAKGSVVLAFIPPKD